ncbi:MAG: triose-phosphate isomerase [Patescibacteria group bacterium]
MKKILIGNWKMNLNEEQCLELVFQLQKRFKKISSVEVAVAPSFVYLKDVRAILAKSKIKLAGQNVAPCVGGSCTGEVSAAMLKNQGCSFAIVGHADRRRELNETDEMINKKINQSLNAGLTPILCIGETLEEKSASSTDAVLVRQLHTALQKVNGLPENELIVAYEPVWAIGTGKYFSAAELILPYKTIKRTISSLYSEKFYEAKVRFVYGGSVNSIIAKDYWALDFLQGIFVGTASLDVEEFYNIAIQAEN